MDTESTWIICVSSFVRSLLYVPHPTAALVYPGRYWKTGALQNRFDLAPLFEKRGERLRRPSSLGEKRSLRVSATLSTDAGPDAAGRRDWSESEFGPQVWCFCSKGQSVSHKKIQWCMLQSLGLRVATRSAADCWHRCSPAIRVRSCRPAAHSLIYLMWLATAGAHNQYAASQTADGIQCNERITKKAIWMQIVNANQRNERPKCIATRISPLLPRADRNITDDRIRIIITTLAEASLFNSPMGRSLLFLCVFACSETLLNLAGLSISQTCLSCNNAIGFLQWSG